MSNRKKSDGRRKVGTLVKLEHTLSWRQICSSLYPSLYLFDLLYGMLEGLAAMGTDPDHI